MRRAFVFAALGFLVPAAGQAACTASASGVAFGVYNPFSPAPANTTGTVSVSCTALSGLGTYTVALSTGGGGSFTGRKMTNGATTLSYQLYTNAARATIWGNGTGGSSVVNGSYSILSGGSSTFTVYGQAPALQAVRPGSYIDTIIVTVTY